MMIQHRSCSWLFIDLILLPESRGILICEVKSFHKHQVHLSEELLKETVKETTQVIKIQLFYLLELKVDSFQFLMYIISLLVRQFQIQRLKFTRLALPKHTTAG